MCRDFQKLIFYYYADHYINFKDLITELYRIYKTRIWLSAINPASFSQHALGQPPSGIGPGAIAGYGGEMNTAYTMMYGQDPDPYGAVPPYSVGYETYTPNYPGIPGVANSFAPSMPMQPGYGPYESTSGNATPSLPPGVNPTGTPGEYNYYYNRSMTATQNAPPPGVSERTFAETSPYGRPYPYGSFTSPGSAMQTTPSSSSTTRVGAPTPGRYAMPAPIGTRPGSGGNTSQTSRYTGQDFVPGQFSRGQ